MAVLVVLTGRSIRDIPVIFGGVALRAPLVFFGSLVVLLAHGWSVDRASVEPEFVSRRPVRWADVLLVVVASLPLLATSLVPGLEEVGLVTSRNAATGMGLTLLCARRLPRDVASVPGIVMFLAGALTGRSYGREAWWNWAVTSSTSPVGALWAALAIIAGSCVTIVPQVRRR
ncbi:hypothetical protein O6R08_02370 [Cutibacterium equinum]|uniref:Uncharacterized protein n=1 Tax=Cutibacterium equinum TaxID=3016342 RepID=A0ABY7QZC4_9ACTN|nr:hypothetical protein [Cutibacterium equinum]WCC80394.1 hypothetical protein O6R08_02370 [Cutibacterium equinum]